MESWEHNFAEYITPEKAFEMMPNFTLKQYRQMAKDNGMCDVCGRPVWRLSGLGMCFTCITGESDAGEDYELIHG